MPYFRQIIDEIEFTKNLRSLSQTYQEISVMDMKKVRASVLIMREYFRELAMIYYEVKSSYKREVEEVLKSLEKAKKKADIQAKKKLGKKPSVCVYLSANNKLYGEIDYKVFRLFLRQISKEGVDIIIIGKVGRSFYEAQEVKKPYLYFELDEDHLTSESLRPVIYHLVNYDKITVYHSRFANIVNQEAVITNISGDQPLEVALGRVGQVEQVKYIFEPSLKDLLQFFERLITSALFNETIHESRLARYASRIMAMESVLQNIDLEIKKLEQKKKRYSHLIENKRQQERIAGINYLVNYR